MSATRFCISASIVLFVIVPALAQKPASDSSWPQWRGPARTGVANSAKLLTKWPEVGPPKIWSVDSVGVGYSSVIASGGRVFTQGDLNGVEHVICLDAKTGKTVWAKQPAPVAEKLNDLVQEQFASADQDGDGTITEIEGLKRFGSNFFRIDSDSGAADNAAARVTEIIKALDASKDGSLSYAEAGATLGRTFEEADRPVEGGDATKIAALRTLQLMTQHDADGDSKLTRKECQQTELSRIFQRIDIRDPKTNKGDELLTIEELATYFQKREANKDGRVSAAELVALYTSKYQGRDGEISLNELRSHIGGYRNGMGDGPRGTPTLHGDFLYAEGGNGDVTCFNAANGDTVWSVNLQTELGGGRPGWGYSESPLIEGDLVIVTPGGKQGTLAALNKNTGEVVWRSTDLTEGAHYSSPIAADINGVRQIVQFARSHVFGVEASTGKLLWKYDGANNGTANCFTPIVQDNLVFVSSAYGTGSGLAKVSGSKDEQQAEEVYFLKKLASHHGGAVKIGDHLYSNGGGSLMCIEFETGDIVWQDRSVGKGSLIAADGMLYVFSERHEIALVEATPEEYREQGRFKIESHGRPSWAHPAIASGVLYLRDQGALNAYDISGK